jgi:N-acetylglucosamine kinase-like BadF-type ATPase
VLGAESAIANIVAALRGALGDVPGERVEACVVGLAGVSTLMADPKAPGALERAWADAGLTCHVRLVSDVTVAFAAGTPRADGTLLVSGTGAVAARMRERLPVRFRDGYGWLLGDDGSGFWIGRQAARAAIAAVDGRAPMAQLATAVLEALLEAPGADGPDAGVDSRSTSGKDSNPAESDPAEPGPAESDSAESDPAESDPAESEPAESNPAGSNPIESYPADPQSPPLGAAIGEGFALRGRRRAAELVRAVATQPTAALAGLAPLVMAACELGDPAARRIVDEAARVLVDSLAGVGPVPGEPVVLGGSVLVSRSPVFQAVAAAVRQRWPDSPLGLAADGAAGACWLAARDLLGDQAAAPVHARFTGDDRSSAKFS